MTSKTKGRVRSLNLRRHMPRAALCLSLALAISLLVPNIAYAWDWLDPVGSITDMINDTINGWLRDSLQTMLNAVITFVQGISVNDILIGDFNELLNSSVGGNSVYTFMHNVWKSTVVPIGNSILALVMLIQVVKISQRIDSTATMPAIKEIIFLGVYFVIFTWLINNSFDLCAAAFGEINNIAEKIQESASPKTFTAITIPEDTTIGFGAFACAIVVIGIMFVGAFIAWVVSYVLGWARALQLYVLAAFSPIPFALMGFDETRSFGVNFCKVFISVCLAGAIMVFLIIVYPLLMVGCIQNLTTGSALADLLVDGFVLNGSAARLSCVVSLVESVACTFMYIFAMFKSGTWARDILGG